MYRKSSAIKGVEEEEEEEEEEGEEEEGEGEGAKAPKAEFKEDGVVEAKEEEEEVGGVIKVVMMAPKGIKLASSTTHNYVW